MACIGGVTITAIRFGRGDKEGAQNSFMHSLTLNLVVGVLITLSGSVLTGGVCGLLGASGRYLPLVKEYVFWYALFAAPNALSLNLQSFCRNDGSPGLVAVTNVVSTALNIFLDWLFVFPMRMGVMGAAIAQFSTPVTTLCMNHTLMAAFGDIGINAFAIISYLSSFTMSVFFGADGTTTGFTEIHMWEYCWGFVVGSMNSMFSAYFYSTKRSWQAIALNLVRSLVLNSLVITLLPKIFGSAVIWHTFGIYEGLVLMIAFVLKRQSERNGVVYQ